MAITLAPQVLEDKIAALARDLLQLRTDMHRLQYRIEAFAQIYESISNRVLILEAQIEQGTNQ